MSTSDLAQAALQTPLWVPILLTSIALIGPLGAALLTVRHSNYRLEQERKHEREKERIRHSHEISKINIEFQHKVKVDLRTERINAYSKFFDLLDDWTTCFFHYCLDNLPSADQLPSFDDVEIPSIEQLKDLHTEMGRSSNRLLIIGSKPVKSELRTIVNLAGNAMRSLATMDSGHDRKYIFAKLNHDATRIQSARDRAIDHVRTEVLIDAHIHHNKSAI